MTRSEVRARLEMAWWRQLGLTLAPLLVVCVFFTSSEGAASVMALALFAAGAGSMFISLKPFSRYKRALGIVRKAIDTPEEPAAWLQLAAIRRIGFLAASLPAWIGAAALLFNLSAVAVCLLAFSSIGLLGLYWIPRKLQKAD